MVKKQGAGTGGDFQGPLGHLDTLESQRVEPRAALIRGWPLSHILLEVLPLRAQTARGHFLIDSPPEQMKCAEGREGQDHLAARLKMVDQSADRFEPVRTK